MDLILILILIKIKNKNKNRYQMKIKQHKLINFINFCTGIGVAIFSFYAP